MRYRSLFPRDIFGELDRLQREMQQAVDLSPSIRGIGRGGFPAMNVGGTPTGVEIYAFAPGVNPATLDVQIEKGVLTVAGERKPEVIPEKATVHIDERFAGRFRRVVSLPEDVERRQRASPLSRRRVAHQHRTQGGHATAPHRHSVRRTT